MVRSCEVQWCDNSNNTGHSIHEFPRDKKLRDKWIKFVQVKRANFPGPTASSVICQLHFKEADFKNWGQYKNGFASKLLLNTESAVPTIQSPEQLAEEKGQTHTDEKAFSKWYDFY